MTTVKLDDDVVEALKAKPGSVTRQANDLLRRSLGMRSDNEVEGRKVHPTAHVRGSSPAVRDRPYDVQDCRHPIGRRIGSLCGTCGCLVPVAAKKRW